MDRAKTRAKLINQFANVSSRIARLEIQLEDAKNEQAFLKKQIGENQQFSSTVGGGENVVRSSGLTTQEEELSKHSAIDAIKSVRNRTNLGLKEAKDLVDKFRGVVYKP